MLKRVCCLLAALLFLCSAAVADEAVHPNVVRNGDRNSRQIAITVDDCYEAKYIQEVVDLCTEYGIPVTFFIIGNTMKEENRETYLNALRAGCELASHSYAHASLADMDIHTAIRNLDRAQEALNNALGFEYKMNLIRPPFGKIQRKDGSYITSALARNGYPNIILWDVSQTVASKAIKHVRNGSIMLYHAKPRDIKCLKTLIPLLLEQGYIPVTVSTLIGLEMPAVPEGI